MKHIAKIAICATFFTAIISQSAQAAFTLVKRMSSADDQVVVGEFADEFADEFGEVGYEVDVASGILLHILIVSHTDELAAPSAPSGWSSFNLPKGNWDKESFAGRTGADIGSFESLFGRVDTYAIVYTVTADISVPALSDTNPQNANLEDVEESLWTSIVPRFKRSSGLPATEFVALDTSGMIIGQSIPEPSAALLILSGSMVFLRRRR